MSVSVIAFVGMAAVVILVFAASIIIEFKLKLPKSPKADSTTPKEQGHPASLFEHPLYRQIHHLRQPPRSFFKIGSVMSSRMLNNMTLNLFVKSFNQDLQHSSYALVKPCAQAGIFKRA